MKVLIVDDEPLARARLSRLLTKLQPDCQLLPLAENAQQALTICDDNMPDLVLLDIEMPGISGIELAAKLKQVSPPPAIIFVTAYPDKALPAFAVSPQGYLVKPITEQALNNALLELRNAHRAQHALKQQATLAYLEHGVEKLLPISDIRMIRSEDKYLRVVMPQSSILIEGSLKKLQAEYPDYLLRVHRNTLINKIYISDIGHDANKHWVQLLDLKGKVEVSRREWPQLRLNYQNS